MMATVARWIVGVALAAFVVAAPAVYYRYVYETSKRLREVVPGRFYRCGQLTEDGFARAVRELGIRTIINVQNEFPDPQIQTHFWGSCHADETAMCARLGVRYVFLAPELIAPARVPAERPPVIAEMLRVLDDESVYPVLLHCKAGLHRTGLLTAIYRMEYCDWSEAAAVRELKANGFGEFACTTANSYLVQFLQDYQPRRCR
jgi:protein tyrosine phosphatase (PTP) superfamily phosphohydrolase (DUF442 family)